MLLFIHTIKIFISYFLEIPKRHENCFKSLQETPMLYRSQCLTERLLGQHVSISKTSS